MNRDELREAIRNERDVIIEPVATPEWPTVNGLVFVKSLSIADREAYLTALRQVSVPKEGQVKIEVKYEVATVKLAAAAMCDSEGNTLFGPEDVEWLQQKSHSAMQRVIDAASRLNGFGNKAKAEVKNVSPSAATATT